MGDMADEAADRWYEAGCPSVNDLSGPWRADEIDALQYNEDPHDEVGMRYSIDYWWHDQQEKQRRKPDWRQEVGRKQNLLDELRATRATLERLEDKVTRLSRIPDKDPFADGAVFTFEKLYPNTATPYKYVGLKVGGYFFLTGNHRNKAMSWDEFVDFITDGVDHLWLMMPNGDILEPWDPNNGTAATVA